MANEITTSSLANDLLVAEIMHKEMALLLADRASLRRHPALLDFSDMTGRGSTTLNIPLVGLDGYDEMAAVAEGSTTSNTALTDSAVALTIARQALQYQTTDLAVLSNELGLDPVRLAASMVGSAEMRFTSIICDLVDDFSSTVGTSGVDMDADDFFDAIFTLEIADNDGAFVSILHPRQIADLQNALRAEAGALQFTAATAAMLEAKGVGFIGSLLGVDIFKSSKVVTANSGADRAGGMFTRGAICFAEGSANPDQVKVGAGSYVVPAGTKVMVEFERDAGYAYTKVVGNYYVGAVEIEDSRGVSIITDA